MLVITERRCETPDLGGMDEWLVGGLQNHIWRFDSVFHLLKKSRCYTNLEFWNFGIKFLFLIFFKALLVKVGLYSNFYF